MRTRTAAIALSLLTIALAAGLGGRAVSARSNVGAPVHQSGGTGHTITVAGHGEVSVAPDQATLNVGVQTKGTDAQSALSSNSQRMNAVIGAVQGQGVPSSHIKTSDLSLWYDSEHDSYVATHSLTVTLDGVSAVGMVLDAAVAAGANSSWGVSFGLKDPSAARAQALQAAVADARKRADALGGALGVTISGVGSVTETGSSASPRPVVYAAAQGSAPAATTPVQSGEMTISTDINVVYTF